MSYGTIRKAVQQAAEPPRDESRCSALGCPCRGSMRLEGSGWMCVAHAFIPSDRWPAASERLREFSWLVEFIDEIQKMDRNPGKKGEPTWRDFAKRYWFEQDLFCMPEPYEEAMPYQNRMRGELLYRCGLGKRPHPRKPAERVGRFGNAGVLVGKGETA